ncbi:MAG: hypothetical protein GY861_08210 [bacterium]|nr:hypothetical protein [bacterium]
MDVIGNRRTRKSAVTKTCYWCDAPLKSYARFCEYCEKGRVNKRKIEELSDQVAITIPYDECGVLAENIEEARCCEPIPEAFTEHDESNPHNVPSAFEVNKFVGAFNHVRIKQGYVVDYVYGFSGNGGEPWLYTRKIDSKPLQTMGEYYKKYSCYCLSYISIEPTYWNSLPYLAHLEFDNTPIGFFEFAMFCMKVRRFYLYWHSLYNYRLFFYTEEDIDQIVQGDVFFDWNLKGKASRLRFTNLRPRVKIHGKLGEVIIACYEKNQGFSLLHVHIEWALLHKSAKESQRV